MVTPLSVAVKIWAKTISMAIIIGTMTALNEGEAEVALAFVVIAVVLGFFITSPLLIIYSPLVKLSSLLPYSKLSRMVWLIFFLFLFYLLFFIGMALLSKGYDDGFFKGFKTKDGVVFMLSIIIVQILAVSTTYTSLFKLYEQF